MASPDAQSAGPDDSAVPDDAPTDTSSGGASPAAFGAGIGSDTGEAGVTMDRPSADGGAGAPSGSTPAGAGEARTESAGAPAGPATPRGPGSPKAADPVEAAAPPVPYREPTDLAARRIMQSLARIEAEVRQVLEGRDPKRKRKLSGTRRWLELQEDILALQHTSRIDDASVARLKQLVVQRDYLYGRLRFFAATRPTWNT